MELLGIGFTQLLGFAALVAVLVGAVKKYFKLPDGWAGRASAALNLVGLIVFTGIGLFAPDVDVSALDAQLADLAKYLSIVFAYLLQLLTSEGTYQVLSKAKLAYSHPKIK